MARSLFISLAVYLAAIVLAAPWHNVPLIDDWGYAWSVEELYQHGRLSVLEWSAHYPVTQVVWGTLFSWLFGFSFATLRLSTIALAAIGLAAFWWLLRELDVDSTRATLGTITLALYPVFFVLSASFMTDVPFLSLTIVALACFVAGARRDRLSLMWLGGLVSVAAFFIRQIGVVTPLAAIPFALVAWRDPRRLIARTAPPLAAWLAMVILGLVVQQTIGTTKEVAFRLERLNYLAMVLPANYVRFNLFILTVVSTASFPFLIGLIGEARSRAWWRTFLWSAAGCAAVYLLFFRALPPPLAVGETWNLRELGGARSLIHGDFPPYPSGVVAVALRGVGLLAAALLVAAFAKGSNALRSRGTASAGLALLFLGHFALINLLWLYGDRHELTLVPPALALAIVATSGLRLRAAPICAVLLIWGTVAVLGTRDSWQFNTAVMNARDVLRTKYSAPIWEIDAGYSVNGWFLYAHPENLGPGMTQNKDVPFVTSDKFTPFAVAKYPMDMYGYETLEVMEWNDFAWPGPNRVYLVKKRDEQPAGE